MIYLKEFKIWDKIFGKKKIVDPKELADKWVNNINGFIKYYYLKKDLPISVHGSGPHLYNNLKKDDDIIFTFSPHDGHEFKFYSDGRITIDLRIQPKFEIKDDSLYQKVSDIFFNQRNKWIVYISISNLISEFDEFDSDVDVVGSYDEDFWNNFNELNNDFSFFKYPNCLDSTRLKDLLESDFKIDTEEQLFIDEFGLQKDYMEKLGIVIS